MTISGTQAEGWSCAMAELLSGITDDPDLHCESFSSTASCSPIALGICVFGRAAIPYHTAGNGRASQQVQVTNVRWVITGHENATGLITGRRVSSMPVVICAWSVT